MSYIYEALKRAEDEHARGAGVSRPVRRPVFAVRQRWWLWALIAIVGSNVVVFVALTLIRGSHSRDATRTTASTEHAAGLADVAPSAPSVTVPAPAPVPIQPAAKIAAPVPRVSSAPPSTPAAPPRATADPPTAPAPSMVTRETADPRPASATTPAPVASVAPSSPVVAPPTAAPARSEMPPAVVEPPKLQVQVVLYSEVPAERMVFIDGRRYAEGDRVDAETVVERITPDGAVVTRRGQRFTLTSGRP